MADTDPFFAHPEVLFGRQPDIDFLLQRVKAPGVTFVTARPKMGKTWLLLATAQQLAAPYLVGYHECTGGEELFRYAVQDLYTRWLNQASLREQALQVWAQQKEGWVSKAGGAIASIFGGVSKLTGGIPDGVAEVVKGAMDGLVSANEKLKSGDLALPILAHDQGKELLAGLATISHCPLVLIFDAWEKAGSLDSEQDLLNAYLTHRADWPQVHFLVGLRTPALAQNGTEPAEQAAQDLRNSSAAVGIYPLEPLHLDAPLERARLLAYLRDRLPAAATVTDAQFLDMLKDYPGTLERWTDQPQLASAADLQREADDAERYLYRELDRLLPALSGAKLTLAVRLALLPRVSSDTWPAYQAVVMDGVDEETPLLCCESGLLSDAEIPSFGHDTRHRAVGLWFKNAANFRPRLRKEAGRLIAQLGPQLDFASSSTAVFSAGIRAALNLVGPEGLAPLPLLIARANQAFWDENPGAALLAAAPWPGTAEERKSLASVLARALYNTILDACVATDLPLVTNLLAVLRSLHHDFPAEATVRQRFAAMLVEAISLARRQENDAGADVWLKELAQLDQESAPETQVRHEYGLALRGEVQWAQQRKQFELAAQLAEQLSALLSPAADDSSRRSLAQALQIFIRQGASLGQKPAVIGAWLVALRPLIPAGPANRDFRGQWANGLAKTGMDARSQGTVEISDLILAELLRLYRQFQDEFLGESLAQMAAVEVIWTPTNYALSDSRQWLSVLQQLGRTYPQNGVISKVAATVQQTVTQKLHEFGPKDPAQLQQSLDDLASFAV